MTKLTTTPATLTGASRCAGLAIVAAALLSAGTCAESQTAPSNEARIIRVQGSERMIQLSTAWAEAYHRVNPGVFVQIGGDGPDSPRFSALANNVCDICLSVRRITKDEADRISRSDWGKR